MTRIWASLTLAAGLALGVPAVLASAPAAPAGALERTAAARDWSNVATVTPGGHQLGNPAAATSVVAFISYSCSHCAAFEKESEAPLKLGYLRSGKVALEVRNFIRNPIDLAAALATGCGAPGKFFARHRTLLRTQDKWLAVASAATPAQQQRWSTGPVAARMRAIADDLDFYQLLKPLGLSTAQLDRCLSDEVQARAIATQSQAQGELYNVTGTPSFLINDKLLDKVHTWATLQQALDGRS